MKSTTGLIILAISIMFTASQTAFSQEKEHATLKFEKEAEQLGTIYTDELEPVEMEIEFTNQGKEPLVISHVRGCCGTRIKDWTKKPIMEGETGTIKIEFRLAPRPHNIRRTVSVVSNDPDGMKVFRIRGEVAERSDEPFGANHQGAMAPKAD